MKNTEWITDAKEILLDDDKANAFRAYIKAVGFAYALETFDEAYEGEWHSERDFAEDLFDDLYLHEIPDRLTRYIDYDAFTRDLFDDDYMYIDGYVFRRM